MRNAKAIGRSTLLMLRDITAPSPIRVASQASKTFVFGVEKD